MEVIVKGSGFTVPCLRVANAWHAGIEDRQGRARFLQRIFFDLNEARCSVNARFVVDRVKSDVDACNEAHRIEDEKVAKLRQSLRNVNSRIECKQRAIKSNREQIAKCHDLIRRSGRRKVVGADEYVAYREAEIAWRERRNEALLYELSNLREKSEQLRQLECSVGVDQASCSFELLNLVKPAG